ncbi:MAG: SsrA-binding protein SmpB [Bryobacterales bacterium]|nr:SsrA-binding protein SmpB [Bryobacterales bacterium]
MAATEKQQFKILADNRQARHNYFLSDFLEAGLALTGTEVKSAREGKVQLVDSYAEIVGGEAWLVNAHFSPYSHGNRANHAEMRKRKLLLHKGEIEKLGAKTRERGFTLVPTKVYLKNGLVKVELALAKGKQHHDKRESIKQRENEAEAKAAVARSRRKFQEG